MQMRLIRKSLFSLYTLCAIPKVLRSWNAASAISSNWHPSQRDSAPLSGGFGDRAALEARSKLPAENRAPDPRSGPGLLRPRLARLVPAAWRIGLARGLVHHSERCA